MRTGTIPAKVWLPEVIVTKALPVKEMLPTAMPDSAILWDRGKMYLGHSNSAYLDKKEV